MTRTAQPFVFGVVGWKNAGKTTLSTRLITALTHAGYRVSSIKKTHHAFEVDGGQTDSARHRASGAQQVALMAQDRWALMSEVAAPSPMTLEAMLAKLDPADFILVEGFKSAPIPKIEVRSAISLTKGPPLAPNDAHIFAIARPAEIATDEPGQFERDDIAGLVAAVRAQAGA